MFQRIFEILKEVLQGMLPILVVVVILNFTVIHMPGSLLLQFLFGITCAIGGMTMFLLGVDIGLIPLGEITGSKLPGLRSIYLIAAVVFLIGFAVTITEPDVVVLSHQIDSVSQTAIPKFALIYVIGIGIGVFTAAAILRIVLNIRITYFLAAGYVVVLLLSLFTPPAYVPIAFDAGGVTTGPMTVPVILALGIGFSSVFARQRSLQDGFGLIGLASIGPIIGVMLMGLING
jgi:hypothetical protein